MLNNRTQLLLTFHLLALISSVVLLTNIYMKIGMSATLLLSLIFTFGLLISLMTLFKRKERQLMQVIRALANGDNTLGFKDEHPMRKHFYGVSQQMQIARFDAAQQTEFLKALLVHVELAVMVCDAKGNIIESNPAVARLLGNKVIHLNQINLIGDIILAAEKNLRTTVKWLNGEQEDTLTLQVSMAEIQGEVRKIITLQSVHGVLLNKEQQAYKRLARVLTHEVANTITPLASLAQTCQGLIPEKLNFVDEENKQDLVLALKTLASRTEYLGGFIESFRQVSSLPMPSLKAITLTKIVERIQILHQQQLKDNRITLNIKIETQQLVMLDSGQIEQVLINLVKNAIEAIQSHRMKLNGLKIDEVEDPAITLVIAQNTAQQIYIEVSDNGVGIPKHVTDTIFVPFFTTKQGGTGIGLSLSRQIMVNHGGDLIYVSREKGACFRCIFG